MKPFISVVIPLYNEAGVVEALIRRVDRALQVSGVAYQVVAVDDASSDATPRLLADLAGAMLGRLVVVRPAENLGQFGATCVGLRRAEGEWLAVMDGDLQDPPELLTALVARLQAAPAGLDCVFAVKASREDPRWFRAARAVYAGLLATLGTRPPPRGAGSYCAMRPAIAAAVVAVPVRHANLAPVLASRARRWQTLSYAKQARYDEKSRVGPWGLLREAWGSLLVSGAMRRLAGGASLLVGGAGIAWLIFV